MAATVTVKDAVEMVLAGGGVGGAAQEVRPDGHGILHLATEATDRGDAVPRPPSRAEPRRPGPLARARGRRARHPPPLAAPCGRGTGTATLVRGRRGAGAACLGHGHFHPGAAPGKRRDGRSRRRRRLGLLAANLGHGGAGSAPVPGVRTNVSKEAETQCHRNNAPARALDFWSRPPVSSIHPRRRRPRVSGANQPCAAIIGRVSLRARM